MMQGHISGVAAGCALFALGVVAVPSFGLPALTAEPAQFAYRQHTNINTGQIVKHSPAEVVGAFIYDNLGAPSSPNFGYTEPNLSTPVFGDTLNMAGIGTLDEFDFTIFNSNTDGNTGSITGGSIAVNFFRESDSSFIGGFTGTLDYSGDPLPVGFFAIDGFVDLATLATPIVFDTPNVIVTQELTPTGTSLRNGVASLNPINIGGSPSTVYIASTTTPAGFYNFNPAGTLANFGYAVGITPEPASLGVAGFAVLGLIARRRKA